MNSSSLTRSAAFALTAAVSLIPANLLPVMSVRGAGYDRTDTIFSGMSELFAEGMWVIGGIVFIASMLVPVLKVVGLARLLYAARYGSGPHARELTRLYANLSFIGRWSMLDVFLVAFLSGAVKFGSLADVQPEIGIIPFATVVVFTVLAVLTFDPRMLWQVPSSPRAQLSNKSPT